MQPGGIGPSLGRVLVNAAPGLVSDLLVPGKVLDVRVVSVYGDKALLSLGGNVRLEVTAQVPLMEGQRIRLRVERSEAGAPSGGPIQLKLLDAGLPTPAAPNLQQAQKAAATEGPPGVQAQSAAQVQPAAGHAQAQGQPTVLWLPVPLPQGGQAWTQIHVQEEAPARTRPSGEAVHHVRIWWETPALGAVQVNLDAVGPALSALFTLARGEARPEVEEGLPALQQRLNAAGFTETRLTARQAPPGERPEPAGGEGPDRLDLRL